MKYHTKKVFSVLTIATLLAGAGAILHQKAATSQTAMSLDLYTYCARRNPSGSLVNINNTSDGWRCRVEIGRSQHRDGSRPITRDDSINTDAACKQQYGGNAFASRINWTPSGWKCFFNR